MEDANIYRSSFVEENSIKIDTVYSGCYSEGSFETLDHHSSAAYKAE